MAAMLLCASSACNRSPKTANSPRQPETQTRTEIAPNDAAANSVRMIVASEELLLQLTKTLPVLNKSALNLKLPDHQSEKLFTKQFDDPTMFRQLLGSVVYLERAEFSLVRGDFRTDEMNEFNTKMVFHGLGRTEDRQWTSVNAEIACRWIRQSKGDSESWNIDSWRIANQSQQFAGQLMFREILDMALPTGSLRRARESRHWQLANRHFYPQRRAKAESDDNRFFEVSTASHPGVSVVDIDRDGFDDLYVTVRFGKNLLFRNKGNGTFEEIAQRKGLDIAGRSNAAIFADFDNDGDSDVVIARSFERSLFLANEGGKFVDVTASRIASPMPFEATSVSAADYNNDGLLDLYFSTYHQDDIQSRIDADLSHPDHRIHKYLTSDQSSELRRRHAKENRSFVNQVGPPNILLKNVGDGCFEVAPEQSGVAVWRNSFQSTWSDFDQDGDQDLYVANDFAPDCLLRNDGDQGFKDVSETLGIHEIGFGMGVTWGDYDNDGKQDLYVSNMYSKAGRRITGQIDGLDGRIKQLSQGNYLYKNQGHNLLLASGLAPPALTVARTGWSWGGQFIDVDNDSFLDLYVPNGYFTAPHEFASQVDL